MKERNQEIRPFRFKNSILVASDQLNLLLFGSNRFGLGLELGSTACFTFSFGIVFEGNLKFPRLETGFQTEIQKQ